VAQCANGLKIVLKDGRVIHGVLKKGQMAIGKDRLATLQKRPWIVGVMAGVICLAVGLLLGEEFFKYRMARAFQARIAETAAELQPVFSAMNKGFQAINDRRNMAQAN